MLRGYCDEIGRDFAAMPKTATLSTVAISSTRAEAQRMAEASPFYRPDQPTAAVVGEPGDAVEQLRTFAGSASATSTYGSPISRGWMGRGGSSKRWCRDSGRLASKAMAVATAAPSVARPYWLAWVATVTFFAGFYALLVPLPRYLTAVGLPDWQVGLVLGAFGVASLIG